MDNVKETKIEDSFEDQGIDLVELFDVLLLGKRAIILITSFFALSTLIYSLSLTNYYKPSAVLSIRAASGENSGGISAFSGIAAMAGVSIPTTANEKADLVIATISSRKFFKQILTIKDFKPKLMAPKSFLKNTGELIYDDEIYDPEKKEWIDEPNFEETYLRYTGELSTTKQVTGFIKLSYEHLSPVVAKEILEIVIENTNNILREQDLRESKLALDYLKKEINQTALVEIRVSINELVKAQLEKQMIAEVNKDYILKTIEAPYLTDLKSRPRRAIMSIMGTLFGAFISIFWIGVRYIINPKYKPVSLV